MGGKHSKSKGRKVSNNYGDFVITTDKSEYSPGETVSGIVVLNLLKDYPGKELYIRFRAKEQVLFIRSELKSRSVALNLKPDSSDGMFHYFHHSKNNRILDEKILLHCFQDGAKKDQYCIPFSFPLPTGIPGSYFQRGTSNISQIVYQLSVFLDPTIPLPDVPRLKFKSDVCVIDQTVQRPLLLAGDKSYQLAGGCCRSPSSFSLNYQIEKNLYKPGEIINIRVGVDMTHAKLTMTSLTCSLKQHLQLQAGADYWRQQMVYDQKVILQINKGNAYTGANCFSFQLKVPDLLLKEPFKYSKRYEPNFLQKLKEPVQVTAKPFCPSVKGKLITSKFFIEILPRFAGENNLEPINAEIHLVYVELSKPELEAPVGWAPKSLEPVTFSLVKNNVPAYIQDENDALRQMREDNNLMQMAPRV